MPVAHPLPSPRSEYSPDSEHLLSCSADSVHVWSRSGPEPSPLHEEDDPSAGPSTYDCVLHCSTVAANSTRIQIALMFDPRKASIMLRTVRLGSRVARRSSFMQKEAPHPQ